MKSYSTSLLCLSIVFTTACAEDISSDLKLNIDPTAVQASASGPIVSYADVLDLATPSVVAVYTSRIVSVSERSSRQPRTMRELYEQLYRERYQPDPNTPTREEKQPVGIGSGVIVSESGYVVTNNHVVRVQDGSVADEIRVLLNDDREYVAELIGTDEKTDVAVLKITDERAFPAVIITDSDKLRVGDIVFAIGNPRGVGLTATQGIVSATGRDLKGRILGRGSYESFIQTDAAINMGNSGGALVDAQGRLIGINTAILSDTGGSIGLGFAVPSQIVLNVLTNLVENGEVPRGMLGLFPEDLTRDLADAFGLESTRGALVNQVQPDSPSDKAGIRHGDIILKVDTTEIDSAAELRLVVSQTLPGTEVQVELVRNGEPLTLPVTLGSLSGKAYGQNGQPSKSMQFEALEGVTLAVISEAFRETYSIPSDVKGLVVTEIAFESPYSESLAKGMVISEVNGTKVSNLGDIEAQIEKGVNRLYVWMNGTLRFISLRVK